MSVTLDPRKKSDILNFDRTTAQLQAFMLFGILAANKRAATAASSLERLLRECRGEGWPPFRRLREQLDDLYRNPLTPTFRNFVKSCGIGNHDLKSRAIKELVRRDPDLRTCTREEMVEWTGVGWKTASFFLMFTREDSRVASLDTHVLGWMRDHAGDFNLRVKDGFIPKQTPGSPKRYLTIEALFLDMADVAGWHPAELDYEIWSAREAGYDLVFEE